MPANSIKTFNRRGYGVTVRSYSCYTSNELGPPLTKLRCKKCDKRVKSWTHKCK